jgi:two-component system chemotaxis response regulator CheY
MMDSRRLLVCDDALIIRKRIKQIAEETGWTVVGEAEDGEQALRLYQQEQPDLVTMDIVMPRLDGVTALKQLIAYDPSARVVMISAVNQKEKLADCIRSGAIDFIVKPFKKADLRRWFEKNLTAERPSQDNRVE